MAISGAGARDYRAALPRIEKTHIDRPIFPGYRPTA
jgi:hypothetical protein